jgi:hypothetical protein
LSIVLFLRYSLTFVFFLVRNVWLLGTVILIKTESRFKCIQRMLSVFVKPDA